MNFATTSTCNYLSFQIHGIHAVFINALLSYITMLAVPHRRSCSGFPCHGDAGGLIGLALIAVRNGLVRGASSRHFKGFRSADCPICVTIYNIYMPSRTIAVAMSGGVDSSAVAAMLRAEGHNVIGLTMQLWNQRRLAGHAGMPEQVTGRCCSLDDIYDARRVAETIGIPYYVVNHEERFERDVVRPFVEEYLSGRTPIPCSLCNNHLKFDQLLTVAQQIGAEQVATGHYARVEFDE